MVRTSQSSTYRQLFRQLPDWMHLGWEHENRTQWLFLRPIDQPLTLHPVDGGYLVLRDPGITGRESSEAVARRMVCRVRVDSATGCFRGDCNRHDSDFYTATGQRRCWHEVALEEASRLDILVR